MKKLFIILLIGLLSVSCMTVKRIEKHCDDFAKICVVPVKKEVEIITNTVTEIKYRDTTIYIKVPGKEVIKKMPVYITRGIVNSELSSLTVPFAESTAQVVNSKLAHKLMQTDTLLRVKLENALKVVRTQERQIETLREKYVVTVTENSPFANFAIKVFWGLLIAVVLASGILIWKFKNKISSLFRVR